MNIGLDPVIIRSSLTESYFYFDAVKSLDLPYLSVLYKMRKLDSISYRLITDSVNYQIMASISGTAVNHFHLSNIYLLLKI